MDKDKDPLTVLLQLKFQWMNSSGKPVVRSTLRSEVKTGWDKFLWFMKDTDWHT